MDVCEEDLVFPLTFSWDCRRWVGRSKGGLFGDSMGDGPVSSARNDGISIACGIRIAVFMYHHLIELAGDDATATVVERR